MRNELEKIKDDNLAEFFIELLKGIDPTNSLSIVEKGAKYFEARHNKRIYEFNKSLFHGKASEYEKNKLKDGILSEDDYFALLSSAINDDEEKKTTIYVTLYRNILKDKVQNDKFKILKVLKSLTYSSLTLIQKIYIYYNFDIKDNDMSKTVNIFLKEMYKNEDYIFEIESLKQFGLLKVPEQNIHIESTPIEQTKFCLNIAELFFNDKNLKPEAINQKSWTTTATVISDLEYIDDIVYISRIIGTIGLRTVSTLNFNADIMSLRAPIIICIFSENKIPANIINTVKKMPIHKKIIIVSLEKSNIKQLSDIGKKVIYLEAKNKESEENFLNTFDVPNLYK